MGEGSWNRNMKHFQGHRSMTHTNPNWQLSYKNRKKYSNALITSLWYFPNPLSVNLLFCVIIFCGRSMTSSSTYEVSIGEDFLLMLQQQEIIWRGQTASLHPPQKTIQSPSNHLCLQTGCTANCSSSKHILLSLGLSTQMGAPHQNTLKPNHRVWNPFALLKWCN